MVWKRFSHPNVLSLVGVSKLTIPFYTVSYWMENGDLNNYLKKNPASNRLQLASFWQPFALVCGAEVYVLSCSKLLKDWSTSMITL